MPSVLFSQVARQDMLTITRWIKQHNKQAAIDTKNAIIQCCHKIASQPLMGRIRPEFSIDTRMFPFRNYLIFYDAVEGGIEVLHVLDGRQDIPNLPLRTIRTRPRQ